MNDVQRAVWKRRGLRTAVGLVLFLVVFGLFGFLVAPGLIKSVAEKQIAEALGRKATIGAVHLNPYLLAATLDDFRLFQADGRAVAVQVESLRIDLSSASLWKRALVFDALGVVKPTIHVTRFEAQRFDFTDIVERLAKKPKSDEPFRFSLNNIQVDGGVVDFDDRVGGRRHVVDAIHVGLPFLSNLPYDTDINVTPAFSARVDGSAIGVNGTTQPFSSTRSSTLEFDVADLDLGEYVGLAPTRLPFDLTSGRLNAKLALAFKAATTDPAGKAVPQSVSIAGHVGLTRLALGFASASRDRPHAIAVEAIDVEITKLDPFGEIRIASVAIHAPAIDATRRADGSFDLVDLFRMPEPAAPSPVEAPAAKTPAPPPAPLSIATFTIDRGTVRLVDETLARPATTMLQAIAVKASNVALRGNAPTVFEASLDVGDGEVRTSGTALVEKRHVEGTLDIKGFRPARIEPYLAAFLAARLDDAGSVDAHARFRIEAATPLTGLVDEASVRIGKLRATLPDEKSALVAAESIALDGASFDLATRAFTAESLTLTAPVAVIRRDARGRLNLGSAIAAARPVSRPTAVASATPAPVEPAVEVQPANAPAFTALVRKISIARGDVSFEDLSLPRPARVHVAPLDVEVGNVGTAATAVIPFDVKAGVEQRGRLAARGTFSAAPLAIDATLDFSQVAVAWLAAYAGDRLNIVVENADVDTRGVLRVVRAKPDAPLGIGYRGSLRVSRMRARDRITADPFVEWKTLDVASVDLRIPETPGPLAVTLGTVGLSDFYARLIVNASGRLNLQDVVASGGTQQSVTSADASAPAPTPGPAPAPTATPAAAAAGPKPVIRVAGIQLTRGRLGITDNFIKPNYSANLTDLDGRVAAIASDDPKPAALKLTGRIDGEGTLNVQGSVNPLAATLYTDIQAEAKDIELTRLSPYAVKYAGYAIERGRLSTTVKYHIENGRLDASNRLFLDQLTFGEHDAGSTANLPVRLAVALLANSRGEIDIELPISGSLSDPQFSVGGVLWRAFLNLVARAVTSPFALIGSAFGGGSEGELGYIQFKPGVSDLTDLGKTKLETLAKALAERPALKLDIIGRYDPATDRDGIKRDHLLDRLKDLKAKDQSKGGDRVGRDDVTIAPGAEYDGYLARVYDDTKLPDKPRNLVGIAKTVPAAEMEQRLLANIPLDPNDPRWLAEARADVVRHYIEGTGKIAAGRVFLVTPKLDASGIVDQGVPNRVDFSIR